MLYLSLLADLEWIKENAIFISIHFSCFYAPLLKPDLSHTNPFAHYWAWFCSFRVFRQFLNNRDICLLLWSCRKLVYKLNQSSIYRRRELKYRTEMKCDDFKLWQIQIGIFVLYVRLVVRTTLAQAQTFARL